MDKKKCEEVTQNRIEAIVLIFKEQQKQDTERIVSCLDHYFKQGFIKWATITYNGYPEELIIFISNSSFTDGILKFTEEAVAGGVYQGRAGLKTILFSFFRNKLLENLKKEQRSSQKEETYAREQKEETASIDDDNMDSEERYLILERALEKMEPMDKQIIIWRHMEEKSCDEIARLLAINTKSATNRIYRCMQRLRDLIKNSN